MARQEIQLDVQSLLRRTPAAGKAQLCTRLVDEVLVRTRLALQESKPIFSHLGQPVVRRETHDLRPWWFLGDIHGDYFALHTLLQHVYSQDPDANVCFLGDVVDRGLDSAECILLILMLALERPGKTIWIAGNHD